VNSNDVEDEREEKPVMEEEEVATSEESDSEESDYEEAKKPKKTGKSKAAPKKTAAKKTAAKKTAKKESKRAPAKKSEKKAHKTKSAAVPKAKSVFEDILDESEPTIKDKDFSNLAGLVPKRAEVNFAEEEDLGGGDWRCMGAVDY
jgi:hypothetical protein